jgi:hypothetical protein
MLIATWQTLRHFLKMLRPFYPTYRKPQR